jgi:hypothetical protein
MSESTSNKKRHRLTTTDVVNAIDEMYRATLSEKERAEYGYCSVMLQRKGLSSAEVYAVDLYRSIARDQSEGLEHILSASSVKDFDSALKLLLEKVKVYLEDHKRSLLSDIDYVVAKHRGALRVARKSFQEPSDSKEPQNP